MRLVPEGWRWPRAVTHVLDSDSKTATLGFMIFGVATAGLFMPLPGPAAAHIINSNDWLICVAIASTLIGGKLVSEHVRETLALKLGVPAPAANLKEVNPDAAQPTAPAPAA